MRTRCPPRSARETSHGLVSRSAGARVEAGLLGTGIPAKSSYKSLCQLPPDGDAGRDFDGLGKRPVFTPAHHVDLLTGMMPPGPMICFKRKSRSFGARAIPLPEAMGAGLLSCRSGGIVVGLARSAKSTGFARRSRLAVEPASRLLVGALRAGAPVRVLNRSA